MEFGDDVSSSCTSCTWNNPQRLGGRGVGLEAGGVLGESEIRERAEAIQTTALLRSARILRRVMEI